MFTQHNCVGVFVCGASNARFSQRKHGVRWWSQQLTECWVKGFLSEFSIENNAKNATYKHIMELHKQALCDSFPK